MVTENNITTIDITGEAYEDDQFILASQEKEVFYVENPSCSPNWRVVQHVNHRSVWDIAKDGLSDIDLLQDNSSLDFMLFVDLGNLQQNLHWIDRDVIQIVQPVNTAPQNIIEDASFLNDDDDYKEDDERIEEYADEEIDEENDIDTEEEDDDDDQSSHDSDSN